MAFVVIVLTFVVIIRYSIAIGYSPYGWALIYGAVTALSFLALARMELGASVLFGVSCGAVLCVVLAMMKKTDGTSLLWWPLLLIGIWIPFWVPFIVGRLVY